jgi:uncharacterized protein YecA (UPF0149 family)
MCYLCMIFQTSALTIINQSIQQKVKYKRKKMKDSSWQYLAKIAINIVDIVHNLKMYMIS